MPIFWALGAAALSIGGSIYSANKQSKAIKSAATTNQVATDKAVGLQDKALSTATNEFAPYTAAGADATKQLSDPNAFFKASPGYQYQVNQGINQTAQSAAFGGLLKSGGAAGAAASKVAGIASNDFSKWWDQQLGRAKLGYDAASSVAGATQTNANNQGNLLTGNAAVQGDASLASANVASKLASNVTGAIGGAVTGGDPLSALLAKYGSTTGSSFAAPKQTAASLGVFGS